MFDIQRVYMIKLGAIEPDDKDVENPNPKPAPTAKPAPKPEPVPATTTTPAPEPVPAPAPRASRDDPGFEKRFKQVATKLAPLDNWFKSLSPEEQARQRELLGKANDNPNPDHWYSGVWGFRDAEHQLDPRMRQYAQLERLYDKKKTDLETGRPNGGVTRAQLDANNARADKVHSKNLEYIADEDAYNAQLRKAKAQAFWKRPIPWAREEVPSATKLDAAAANPHHLENVYGDSDKYTKQLEDNVRRATELRNQAIARRNAGVPASKELTNEANRVADTERKFVDARRKENVKPGSTHLDEYGNPTIGSRISDLFNWIGENPIKSALGAYVLWNMFGPSGGYQMGPTAGYGMGPQQSSFIDRHPVLSTAALGGAAYWAGSEGMMGRGIQNWLNGVTEPPSAETPPTPAEKAQETASEQDEKNLEDVKNMTVGGKGAK